MSDLRDFQEGVKELYETIGTTEILFYPLDTSQVEDNIYNEFVNPQQYLEPIQLSGVVSFGNSSDILNTGNSLKIPHLNISIAYLVLEENNLLDFSVLEQGRIEFQNVQYQIYEVEPKAFFLGQYKNYVIRCKRVR